MQIVCVSCRNTRPAKAGEVLSAPHGGADGVLLTLHPPQTPDRQQETETNVPRFRHGV